MLLSKYSKKYLIEEMKNLETLNKQISILEISQHKR